MLARARASVSAVHQAADAYERATRGQGRRLPVPTGSSVRARRGEGRLRGMEFVRTADTRRLLQTLDQLTRLRLTLAALREQQGPGDCRPTRR